MDFKKQYNNLNLFYFATTFSKILISLMYSLLAHQIIRPLIENSLISFITVIVLYAIINKLEKYIVEKLAPTDKSTKKISKTKDVYVLETDIALLVVSFFVASIFLYLLTIYETVFGIQIAIEDLTTNVGILAGLLFSGIFMNFIISLEIINKDVPTSRRKRTKYDQIFFYGVIGVTIYFTVRAAVSTVLAMM